jgi:hypothetical protein
VRPEPRDQLALAATLALPVWLVPLALRVIQDFLVQPELVAAQESKVIQESKAILVPRVILVSKAQLVLVVKV